MQNNSGDLEALKSPSRNAKHYMYCRRRENIMRKQWIEEARQSLISRMKSKLGIRT